MKIRLVGAAGAIDAGRLGAVKNLLEENLIRVMDRHAAMSKVYRLYHEGRLMVCKRGDPRTDLRTSKLTYQRPAKRKNVTHYRHPLARYRLNAQPLLSQRMLEIPQSHRV